MYFRLYWIKEFESISLNIEILDIVDEKDKVIYQLDRESIYKKELKSFRTVNAFLMNKSSKLWIPIRHAKKNLWPLHLDTSVGGHVKSGENYEEAIIREANEELRLSLTIKHLIFLSKISPYENKVTSFMKFFLIKQELFPNYNHEDFIWGDWFSIRQIKELINKKVSFKPDFYFLFNLLEKEISN